MACALNHSKLGGLKFCTECGAPAENPQRFCTQGHELVRKNKFCETCGSPEANVSTIGPMPSTPQMAPRVVPPLLTTTENVYSASPQLTPPLISGNSSIYPSSGNRNKVTAIAASIAAVVIALAVIFVNANKVTYTSVSVSMSIYDENCWNLSWGYFDIPSGQVVISVDGKPTAYANYSALGTNTGLACKFETTFYNVPTNGEYYAVYMSSGRRGTITKSKAEMEADGWAFDLSLGA